MTDFKGSCNCSHQTKLLSFIFFSFVYMYFIKVAIAYQQLPDVCIEELPIPKLQKNGFLFIWVINNKYSKAFEMMKKWGYT